MAMGGDIFERDRVQQELENGMMMKWDDRRKGVLLESTLGLPLSTEKHKTWLVQPTWKAAPTGIVAGWTGMEWLLVQCGAPPWPNREVEVGLEIVGWEERKQTPRTARQHTHTSITIMSSGKHLLNTPDSLVLESLRGLCAVNPQLGIDESKRGEFGS
jgi:hypothetical protein